MASRILEYNNAELPKPRLRGWIHALTAPLALANGILLAVFAPDVGAKIACLVFLAASFLLFANSGIYHIGAWSPRVEGILRRIDHANIFLLIAGTYTPLAVLLLDQRDQLTVLLIVWGGAIAGSLMHIFWPTSLAGLTCHCILPWDGWQSGTYLISG